MFTDLHTRSALFFLEGAISHARKFTTEAQRRREYFLVALSAPSASSASIPRKTRRPPYLRPSFLSSSSASLRLRGEIVFPSVFSAASVADPKEDNQALTF